MGDRELFALVAKGNEAAFTEIYLRYLPQLYAHASKLMDSETWAEEIVQDVFTKLWQVRTSLPEIENPSAYIYRMTANRCMDHLRHKQVEAKMQFYLMRQVEHLSKNVTQEQIDFRLSQRLLSQAIDNLSAQRQLVFKLKHEEGLNNDEIASRLNISKNTVRNHIADAIISIRDYLIKQGIVLLVVGCCTMLKNNF